MKEKTELRHDLDTFLELFSRFEISDDGRRFNPVKWYCNNRDLLDSLNETLRRLSDMRLKDDNLRSELRKLFSWLDAEEIFISTVRALLRTELVSNINKLKEYIK